jgi:hypothetical protein
MEKLGQTTAKCSRARSRQNGSQRESCLRQPSYGNSQDAPLLTKGLRKCGIYTQWNFIQPNKNEILSFASKWMELKNIILSKVSQAQKAKRHMLSLM